MIFPILFYYLFFKKRNNITSSSSLPITIIIIWFWRTLTAMVTSQKPLPSLLTIQILVFEPSNPSLKFTLSFRSFFNRPSLFLFAIPIGM